MNAIELPRRGRRLHRAASLFTLSLLVSGVAAQEACEASDAAPGHLAGALPAAPKLLPIHTASADRGYDYGIWGAGPDYKVSFHDGATFVPVLGREFPHNLPWRWTTTSVTVGQQQLVTQAPRLAYEGLVARYALGAVTERYELREDGLEQTFVLDRRVGEGDLVVRGAIDSQLHGAAVLADHQPLRFVDDAGRHLLSYGAATAVDAAGRRQPMTTAFADGVITLRLDAQWLAAASYPVVVDPLVGFGTHLIGSPQDKIDVVHDSESVDDGGWVAYSRYTSASDRDIAMYRWLDDGQVGSWVFSDMTASWSSQGPSLSYVAGADRAVLVFDRWFPNNARVGRYHRHLRTDNSFDTAYGVVNSSDSMWRLDVGGTTGNASGNLALVVWQDEGNGNGWAETIGSTVRGAWIDLVADVATPSFQIAAGALTDTERPSVNQLSSGSAQNSWLVAYQARSTLVIGTPDDWDIGVREVAFGAPVSAPTWIATNWPYHKFAPWIEGQNGRYLVMFVRSPDTGPVPTDDVGHGICTTRLDWVAQSGVGTQPHGPVLLQNFQDARLRPGGLGFDRQTRSHWLMMYQSTATDALYLRQVGFRGTTLWSHTLAGILPDNLCGGVSFDAGEPQFLLAYQTQDSNYTFLTTDRFVYETPQPVATVGSACSAASISWLGSQQIGSQFCGPRVSGAAWDSLHLMVVAMQPAQVQLFGLDPIQDGCWLLVPPNGPDHLGILDLRVGSLCDWSLPLPEYVASTTLYLQDFHTVGNGAPFELVSTPRLEVPIVK
ncbi:MAG: hypothetical protein R3F29_09875 [Planctomycetota bacterium]